MFFQGRGTTKVQKRNTDGSLGPAQVICQDTLAIALSTDSFEHTNKCGAVDVPDYRGLKSSSGTVTLAYSDVKAALFALGVLGVTTTPANSTPVSVSDESLVGADGAVAGDVFLLGGATPHGNVASVVLSTAGSPSTSLTLNTDYTLDTDRGEVTFLTDQPDGVNADYTYVPKEKTSLLTAGQPEYQLTFDYINKANNNAKGRFVMYRVRFDPAKTIDMLSDELQQIELDGSVLADLDRDGSDEEFGQFGFREL